MRLRFADLPAVGPSRQKKSLALAVTLAQLARMDAESPIERFQSTFADIEILVIILFIEG